MKNEDKKPTDWTKRESLTYSIIHEQLMNYWSNVNTTKTKKGGGYYEQNKDETEK